MENKQAWTPGPWTFANDPKDGVRRKFGTKRAGTAYEQLGTVYSREDTVAGDHEAEANAKLIAKAPELVESLKEFVALANFDADTIPKTGEEWDAMVAKAERILREADAL